MLNDNEDVFDSVTWETPSGGGATYNPPPSGPGFRQSTADSAEDPRPHDPKWEGYLITSVKDPVKELAETKDAYVSYLVSAKVRLLSHPRTSGRTEPSTQTDLPIFSTPNPSSRRRFQDFVFLRNHLKVDFPACVVPPLPDKHRLGTQAIWVFGSLSPSAEYVTGDRFSPEFMEKRRLECVSDPLFVLTRSFGSGSTGSYNAYRVIQHCNGVHS